MRNVIGTILGRKGTGKSWLVREILTEFPRVLILDTVAEYGAKDGAVIADGFAQALSALEEADGSDAFKISIRLVNEQHALAIAEIVWEFRNVLFVVEEASAYLKPQAIPDPFKRLVLMGRHRGISQLYVAQRPARLHRDLTTQSDFVVTFQQHGSTDIAYLADVFGDDAKLARELSTELHEIMVAGPAVDRAPKAVKRRIRERRGAGRSTTVQEGA
jgi:DNA helicase HerA-like ATPase